jgi:membrane fusion protein YbhG
MRRRLVPIVVVLLAAAGYGGYQLYLARQPYEWSGTVQVDTITVGSRVGGRVADVLVREGDRVVPGQALVRLEPGDLPAQKAGAEGQLAAARASLEKLQKGARPEEIQAARARAQTAVAALAETRAGARKEQIAAARARLEAAQASLDKATGDSERARRLLANGAIAPAEADATEAALRGARAQRDAQRKTLDELENGARAEDLRQAAARAQEAQANASLVEAGSRVEDLKAAEAQVTVAQARVDQLGVMLDELTIRAPRPARVETLDLRPGDILAPNAPAATLLEDDRLFVRIYVPETKVGLIKVGQEVPVVVDSFPARRFVGVVQHINQQGEYSPRNLQTADERADQVFGTRIALKDGAAELRAGMAAFIRVPK